MNTRLLIPRLGPTPWIVSSLAMAIATGSPIPLDTLVVRRVNIPMTIQASKSDPPRVAFDQLTKKMLNTEDATQDSTVQTVDLNQVDVPKEVKVEPVPPQSLHRKIELQPMLVSAAEPKWIPQLVVRQNEETMDSAEPQTYASTSGKAPTEAAYTNAEGYLIKGSFGLAPEGIAFGPGKRFEIRRKTEAGTKETGQIDPWSSQFSIQVPELSGTLIVRLFDEKGLQEGEGSFRLSQLVVKRDQPIKISVSRSRTEVVTNSTPYVPKDESMFGPPKPNEKGVKTNMLVAGVDHRGSSGNNGELSINRVHPSTWNLIRAEGAAEYEPGIFLTKAGNETRLPMFRKKMIAALRSIAFDQGKQSALPPSGSVVWGRVIQAGRGVANAKVHAETFPDAQVVYFNQLLIPDEKLQTTSANGYFAILDLPSGMHGVMASIQGSYYSHANVITDEGAVSPVELESAMNYDTTSIRVFDAFSGQAEVAELEMQSLPKPITVFSDTAIQMPDLKRLSYVRVTPQSADEASFVMPYMDSDDEINVPLLKNEWINQIIQQSGIEKVPETGVIVGFVRDQDYEVYLPHVEAFPADYIRYFDKKGRPCATGVKGGGFLIMNVPAGIQSVTVYSQKEDLVQSQLLPVDADSLGVLKFSF